MTTRTVICTTGTSIARGAPRFEQAGSEDDYRAGIRERLAKLDSETGGDSAAFLAQASAETHTLLALDDVDEIVLLCTDTADGEICAQELARLIERKLKTTPSVQRIKGLQVTDAVQFRRVGVQNLFAALSRLREARPPATHELILNATGGYKGVVAYLTLYGLLYRLRVVYLFEFGDELVHLPPAPLSFDFEGVGRAREALAMLRREDVVEKHVFFDAIEGLEYHERERFEALVEEVDGLVTLSCFGELLEDARESGRAEIWLHEKARAAYESADGHQRPLYDSLLSNLADPMWRASHYHSFQGTDLSVWKMSRTARRVAAYEVGRRIYVCHVSVDAHADYERNVANARRCDFEGGAATPYQRPTGDTVTLEGIDLAGELVAQQKLVAELESQQLETLTMLEDARAELGTATDALAASTTEREALRSGTQTLETDLAAREAQLQALRTQLNEARQVVPEPGLRHALRLVVGRGLKSVRKRLPF